MKTYMDTGIATEEVVEIVLDTIREIASRLDMEDIVRCVKEKHPTVTEEQWDLFARDDKDVPDIRDMDVLNGLLEEMGFKEAIQKAVELASTSDQDEKTEKVEE